MRKPIAMFAMLVFLAIYTIVIATIGSQFTDANGFLQLLFYAVAGVAWAFPLKPLMTWMNSEPSKDP